MLWGGTRFAVAGISFIMWAAAAQAQVTGGNGAMTTTGWASPPIGHVQFCRTHSSHCVAEGAARPVALDSQRWRQLVSINEQVNRDIIPASDLDLYGVEELWTLPVTHGDCEDYVLLKRHRLISQGWPSASLLITVVFDEEGEGHAVLAARTDRGDLILDNKTDAIRVWTETPYRYVKRQSESDPKRWVSISDTRWAIGTASTGR